MREEQTHHLYLIRHGVTDWNRAQRFQGHTDIPLNAEGREQIRRIAGRIARLPETPQAIWASDLSRAKDTAEALAEPFGLSVQTTPLLREMGLGEWEGLNREEITARGEAEQLRQYRLDPVRFRPPGGESLEEAWARMVQVGESLRAAHPSGIVIVVGHGGTLRTLLCAALGSSVFSVRHLYLDNASLSIVEHTMTDIGPLHRVLLINDTSHLRISQEM